MVYRRSGKIYASGFQSGLYELSSDALMLSQEHITAVYGWTSVAIVAFLLVYLFGRSAVDAAKSVFTGVYQVRDCKK
jgi:hypothetical protein